MEKDYFKDRSEEGKYNSKISEGDLVMICEKHMQKTAQTKEDLTEGIVRTATCIPVSLLKFVKNRFNSFSSEELITSALSVTGVFNAGTSREKTGIEKNPSIKTQKIDFKIFSKDFFTIFRLQE